MITALKKDIRKHMIQYSILFAGLFVNFFVFLIFDGQTAVRNIASYTFGGFYFAWGIIHHLILKDLHLKIALEYFLIGIIGTLLLLSINFRS